jgi:two-component system response regulator PilR (NtrC family)
MGNVLVVDDEKAVRDVLKAVLEKEGHRVTSACDGEQALQAVTSHPPDLVISDIRMPKLDGIKLLGEIRERDPDLPVILVTAYASSDSTIQAMRLGAYDYLTKPFRIDEVRLVVEKALARRPVRAGEHGRRSERRGEFKLEGIIGGSPKMIELYKLISKIAALDSTVLITGESGTGKELVARTIHCVSDRADGPFLAIDCAALPEPLLESELFGHVKGAFTGAASNKPGLFEIAHHGTLFLDEIAEMSPGIQAKLLRFLQHRTVRQVGGTQDLEVDVRVIAATNKDLAKAIATGRFREDLFYRVHVIPIHVPPLRERREDVPLLANSLLAQLCLRHQRPVVSISSQAMDLLVRYRWPGNVRELENVLERALAVETADELTPASLPPTLHLEPNGGHDGSVATIPLPPEGIALEATISGIEKDLMRQALERSGWVQKRAAELLGISFRSFRHKAKKYGITRARGTP